MRATSTPGLEIGVTLCPGPIREIDGERHRLEIDGEVQDATEIVDAYDQLKSRMDLDNTEERKAELEEELEQPEKKAEENIMFCLKGQRLELELEGVKRVADFLTGVREDPTWRA